MPDVLPVLVSAVVAFVLSGVWYGVFGGRLAALHEAYREPRPRAATAAVELVRNLVLAVVTGVLADRVGVSGVGGGLLLGLLLWIGFPAVILAGSVFHERVPWQLAAIHAGDWLLKLLAVAAIVGAWR
jgi:uncharacterized protein DUF1761